MTQTRWLVPAWVLGACLLIGCGGSPYGPLAVIHADDGLIPQVGGGEGRLEIGACVVLVGNERRQGLVWPDNQTQWNALTGQILFHDPTWGDVTLSNGEYINIGGAEFESDGSGVRGDPDDVGPATWVAPPGTCPTDFVVHEVGHLTPPEDGLSGDEGS